MLKYHKNEYLIRLLKLQFDAMQEITWPISKVYQSYLQTIPWSGIAAISLF